VALVGAVAPDRKAADLARLEPQVFLASRSDQVLAERHVERAIGRVIDASFHLITETGGAPPSDHYASFLDLVRLGVLDPALAQRLAPSAGIRNRLVHVRRDRSRRPP
jgi:uncharacterized protein YutE (UPF0331/DUF86 family)